MGAVGAASAGSGMGGAVDGGDRTDVTGSARVAYHWFHASILDATVA